MASAAVVLAFVRPAVAAPPDLNGTWTFVRQRSDDVRDKVVAALGPGSSPASPRDEAARAWVRDFLPGEGESPEARVLAIEQSASELKIGSPDDVRIYYFGRETTRQGGDGVRRRASVRRDGERLVVEEKAEKDGGHATETYRIEPDGRTLVVRLQLEHKRMREPLDVTLVFQKTTP